MPFNSFCLLMNCSVYNSQFILGKLSYTLNMSKGLATTYSFTRLYNIFAYKYINHK